MMRTGATPYRESLIRLTALRLRYRRACSNPHTGVTKLAALLTEVEDAEQDVERHVSVGGRVYSADS